MTDGDQLPALVGPVEVVGAGLIGTSVALVCRRLGLEVVLLLVQGGLPLVQALLPQPDRLLILGQYLTLPG